jgi:hypothetical protein
MQTDSFYTFILASSRQIKTDGIFQKTDLRYGNEHRRAAYDLV